MKKMSKLLSMIGFCKLFQETKDCKQENLIYQRICLDFLLLTIVSQATALFFGSPSSNFDPFCLKYLLIYLFSLTTIVAINLVVSRKYPRLCRIVLSLTLICYVVVCNETAQLVFEKKNLRETNLLLVSHFQTVLLFLISSKLSWIQISCTIWILLTYVWIRGLNLWDFSSSERAVFLSLWVYLVILPLFCYKKEREEKKLSNSAVLNEKIDFLQRFLMEKIPSAIVTFFKGEIKLLNEKTKEMFSASTNEEITKILKNLKVLDP